MRTSRTVSITVLFTIKRCTLLANAKAASDLPPGVKFLLYLNILAIIVLNGPTERFSNDASKEQPEAFGVSNIEDDLGVVEDEGEEEGEGGGQLL